MKLASETGVWSKLLKIDGPVSYRGQETLRDQQFRIVQGMVRVRSRRVAEGRAPPVPDEWPDVIAKAWPVLWYRPPEKVPRGWCDMLVVMSGEFSRLAPQAQVIDAFEDFVQGGLALRIGGGDELAELPHVYAHVSRFVCRQCGGPARVRRTKTGAWALCGACEVE
jgi:hypothetical protein